MTVSNSTTRQLFACNGVTTARTANFRVIDASQLRVVLYTIATGATVDLVGSGTDYTVTSAGGATTDFTTTTAYSSAYKVIALLNMTLSQETDYVANDSFPAESHETALDKLTLIAQQFKDQISRAALLPEFSATNLSVILPTPTDGYGLVWDGATGTIRNTTVSMATLETEAAALYAIAAAITTVASISANVTSVAGNAANINTVAGIAAAVSTVSSIAGAVSAVSANSANINTVSGISANVTTVAGISGSVTTVAGISASVTTVAGLSTQVTGVYNIRTDVTTVAGISGNVTTVAGISANVTSVAGNATNINAAVSNATNINAVVSNAANINTVAGISANVTTVAGISANVTTVAGITANIATVAGISANITTVAGVSANVTTVATNIASVNTCATNIAAIIDAPNQAAAAAASAAAAAAAAAGISMKSSCRVATTVALTVTYLNGTLGVGATLTNAGAQAALSLDGVSLSVGDRVLVKDQASAFQNGIYLVTVVGTGATNWVLTRVTDYDQAAEIVEGTATIIEEGTTNASHIYVMTHNGSIVVGTTAIDWTSLTANATSANTLTTPRAIYGNNFDGSAALTQIISSVYGGTGNGWTKFSGPTTAEKTFTLPDASCTILTSNALVTAAQGGTANGFFAVSGPASTTKTFTFPNASATVLTDNAAVTVLQGGTGQTSYTNGQLLIGNTTGNTLAKATLTAGTGIAVTNGASSITLATTAGYRALSGTDTVVATDNGKTLTVSGTCALALTAAATIGNFSCYVQNTATTGIQIITITPNGAENLDAANSTLVILPGEIRELNCNATAWTTAVIAPFKLNMTTTASPTLPRTGYQGLYGQLLGGGASGGAGATNGGGGGGGGGYNFFTLMNGTITIASLALTCTIGAGGLSQTSANTAGNAGGLTTVVTGASIQLCQAYGGGAGGGGSLGAGGGGGSIGGPSSTTSQMYSSLGVPVQSGVGANAVTTTFGNGGPGIFTSGVAIAGANTTGANGDLYGGAAGGNATTNPGGGGYYGGAGGGVSKATTGAVGGNSLYGGGGGGGASNVTGGAGGGSVYGGAGGAGGSNGAGTGGAAGGGGGGGAVGTAGSGAGGSGRIILEGIC